MTTKKYTMTPQDVLKAVTNSVRARQELQFNYTREDSAAYALGYIESMFASLVDKLPPKARKQAMAELESTLVWVNRDTTGV